MNKALLFDLDGTLLHSDRLHIQVFIDQFAELGKQIDTDYYLTHIHGGANEQIYSSHFPDLDAAALADEKEARFREQLGDSFPPMPGLPALLEQAKIEGWKMAVVTNAPRVNADAMLSALGLSDWFEVVIIGEECEKGKPDPAPYQAGMKALDVTPNNAIAFEDSPSGMRAARSAGAYCVGLRSSLADAPLRQAGAHITIEDYTDPALPMILARLKEGNAA